MLPHEIEVWYIIPAIRKELAKVLKEEQGLSQKQIASILHISPAAVSQYLNEKRAKEVRFNGEIKSLIKSSANRLALNPPRFTQEITRLTQNIRNCEFICKIHQFYEPDINSECRDCFFSNIQ